MNARLILLALSIQFTLSMPPGVQPDTLGGRAAVDEVGEWNSAMRKEFRQFGELELCRANPTCNACILSC